MDESIRITIEIDSADHAALSHIASEHSQSIAQIAADALRARIENERDFDDAMRAGLADIAAGHVISDEQYLANAAERRRRWLAARAA